MTDQLPNKHPSPEALERTATLTLAQACHAIAHNPDHYPPFLPHITPEQAVIDLQSPTTAYGHVPLAQSPPGSNAFAALRHHSQIDGPKPADTLKRIFHEQTLMVSDIYPCRLFTAWRITRYLAALVSLVDPQTFLFSGINSPELWYSPPQNDPAPPAWLRHCSMTSRIADDLKAIQDQGLSTIFPSPRYPGTHSLFAQVVQATSSVLNIDLGSKQLPLLGHYGMFGLDDPDLIRIFYPRPDEILRFETALAEHTLTLLQESGPEKTRSLLKERYGMTVAETDTLTYLAIQVLQAVSPYKDLQSSRALMISRIDNFANRAREAFLYRDELMALKQLSSVLGLLKHKGDEDENKAGIRIIEEMEQERKTLEYKPKTDTAQE